jgi:defect-in-organelle-trafficking protein DotC
MHARLTPLLLAACLAMLGAGDGRAQSFADLENAKASVASKDQGLTIVREVALKEAALMLGAQWGLGERSREIFAYLQSQSSQLDRKFEFGALMMGVGFLPPVISEARDAVAIEGAVMRVAKVIYKIDEPPRPVRVAPTWRDWLMLGLDTELRPKAPSAQASLPRDATEQIFWKSQLAVGYEQGRLQADEAFELNLAQLSKSYAGMRRYYDLYQRGIVTAPKIVSAGSVANITDPNTIVIGDTVFSVSVAAGFVDKTERWVPLAK